MFPTSDFNMESTSNKNNVQQWPLQSYQVWNQHFQTTAFLQYVQQRGETWYPVRNQQPLPTCSQLYPSHVVKPNYNYFNNYDLIRNPQEKKTQVSTAPPTIQYQSSAPHQVFQLPPPAYGVQPGRANKQGLADSQESQNLSYNDSPLSCIPQEVWQSIFSALDEKTLEEIAKLMDQVLPKDFPMNLTMHSVEQTVSNCEISSTTVTSSAISSDFVESETSAGMLYTGSMYEPVSPAEPEVLEDLSVYSEEERKALLRRLFDKHFC